MNGSDRKRFVQALAEGIADKYDAEIKSFNENANCSNSHYRKLSDILGYKLIPRGKSIKRTLIAIILAAAMLLTGCTVYYCRHEIRDFFVDFYEQFIKLTFDKSQRGENEVITDAYFPSYMPQAYELKNEVITPIMVIYEYADLKGNTITFEQFLLDGSDYLLDLEAGNTEILTMGNQRIYHRYTGDLFHYVWNNGYYGFTINSTEKLEDAELYKIINHICEK